MGKNDENIEIRYCKECGCELTSTNKHKLCDNCRREKACKIRDRLWAVGGAIAALFIVTKGRHGGGGTKA